MLFEVFPAGRKASSDERFGNIVATLAYPLGNTRDSGFRIGQAQEKQANAVALCSPQPDMPKIPLTEWFQTRSSRRVAHTARFLPASNGPP